MAIAIEIAVLKGYVGTCVSLSPQGILIEQLGLPFLNTPFKICGVVHYSTKLHL